MSSKKITPEKPVEAAPVKIAPKKAFPWKEIVSWGVTALLVGILLLVLFQNKLAEANKVDDAAAIATPTPLSVALPPIQATSVSPAVKVVDITNMDTTIPEGVRQSLIHYSVEAGDSIFSIAKQFGLQPESVLWANDDYFHGDPTVALSIGTDLIIPPVDGILYTWKDGDTLDRVAGTYAAEAAKIVSWPSNHIDASDPQIATGSLVMIPGGSTEIRSWIQVVEYTARSGVTRKINGPGGCEAPEYGPVGSGGFIWPSANQYISGFDFTSYHKGIDIAALTGDPVWASDAGTVVYAGWNDTGYGYMVMIDHNNGYATLYAHLSAIYTSCGASVAQGTVLGAAGATGNTTGPHLHFEVRLNSGFVNPHYVLP